jgi:putative toxin-antitoxin system antitoxin component (TIGR02293 family)
MPAVLKREATGLKSIREQLEAVQSGYPLNYATALMEKVTIGNPTLKRRILSQATITRLKQPRDEAPVLKKDLSEKVARIERIWARVLSIYQNDEALAGSFMNRPHMMLAGKTPLEMTLEGETSAAFLNSVLGTIEHGFAA